MISTEETRARAQAVLDYIHAHPEQHSQHTWVDWDIDEQRRPDENNLCGTTMCIAGTTMWLESGTLGWYFERSDEHLIESSIEITAGSLLGLNSEERHMLFYCMDNEYAIQMLKHIIAGDEIGYKSVYNEYIDSECEPFDEYVEG